MNTRELVLFLILEILGFVVAGTVFSLIESRLLAGTVAGFFFITTGLFMVARAWRWADKWRSLTWYPLLIHVFAISVPMLVARHLQADLNFQEVGIWGLRGPVFHRLSSAVFTLLALATLIDWWRARRKARATA